MSNTVVLKGYGVQKEAKAVTAITPGDFITMGATGVSRAATGAVEKTVATENEVVGFDLNHDYAIGENVIYHACHAGMEVNALVAAGAAAIAVGSPLKLSSAGKVSLATLPTDAAAVLGYAMVAVDNSGGANPARIRMEIA